MASFIAIRFYQEANGGPRLTYSVRSIRTIIVDKERSPEFQVFFEGREIKASVTAVEIIFWNGGTKAIRADQVLDPVLLRTADGSPILDVQVKSSRPTTQLGIQTSKLANNSAVLTWKLLAPGDAGIARIFYAGGPATDILMDGRIEGQPGILRADPPEGAIYQRGFDRFGRRIWEIYCALVLLLALAAVIVLPERRGWLGWLGTLLFLLLLSALAYGTWWWEYREPPVGF